MNCVLFDILLSVESALVTGVIAECSDAVGCRELPLEL